MRNSKHRSGRGFVGIEALENRQLLAVDFSIATITDTQYVVESFPQTFINQTQWIANNASSAYNIKFMSHQGDLLRRGYSDYQAGNADDALKILDDSVPYTVAMGNHDYDNQFDDLDHHISSANFTRWFGDARYAAIPGSGLGGSSLDGRNRYHIFEASGQKFLVLNLEFEAPDAALAWGQSVIDSHRDLPVILTTHAYLGSGGRRTSVLDTGISNSGEQIYQKFVKPNPQVFMVFSGHSGAVYSQVSLNNAGSNVYEIVADFEGRSNGGDGWMQLVGFNLTGGTISLTNVQAVTDPITGLPGQTGQIETGLTYSGINFAQRFNFGGVIANNDTLTLVPGAEALTFDVRANDAGAALATVVPGLLPEGVVQNADGTFTFSPGADFRGDVSFTYTLGSGTASSNAAAVTLRVNTAPTGLADSFSTPESKSITFDPVGNDTDADAADVAGLKPILASLPPGGALYVNADHTFTYTPDPKFVGIDTFSYYLSDGKTTSGPYTVTVNVTVQAPIYNYPIAETTSAGTRAGSLANLQASDGVEETISEVPRSNGSDVDQRWQFNVTGGTDVIFAINARRSWGADEFHLAYSTNGSTWIDMIRLVAGSSRDVTRVRYEAAEPYQMWGLPSTTRGTVWIRATDTVNGSGETAETLGIDEMFIRCGADVTAPSAATNLAVTGTTTSAITMSWTAATDDVGVAGYDVYRVDAGGDVKIGTTATTSYTAGGLSASTSYSFYVVARDAAGNVALASNVATASTLAPVAPSAPSNLTIKAFKNRQVQLTWKDNSTNETGFHVWSSRDGVNWSLQATVSANAVTWKSGSLARGVWYFRVTSYADTLESTPSNVVSASL